MHKSPLAFYNLPRTLVQLYDPSTGTTIQQLLSICFRAPLTVWQAPVPMASTTRKHLVLLGDSILDNKTYTGAGRCVTQHLRAKLSADDWQVTNCAIDGW